MSHLKHSFRWLKSVNSNFALAVHSLKFGQAKTHFLSHHNVCYISRFAIFLTILASPNFGECTARVDFAKKKQIKSLLLPKKYQTLGLGDDYSKISLAKGQ